MENIFHISWIQVALEIAFLISFLFHPMPKIKAYLHVSSPVDIICFINDSLMNEKVLNIFLFSHDIAADVSGLVPIANVATSL